MLAPIHPDWCKQKNVALLTVTNFYTVVTKFVARAALGTEMKMLFHFLPRLLTVPSVSVNTSTLGAKAAFESRIKVHFYYDSHLLS